VADAAGPPAATQVTLCALLPFQEKSTVAPVGTVTAPGLKRLSLTTTVFAPVDGPDVSPHPAVARTAATARARSRMDRVMSGMSDESFAATTSKLSVLTRNATRDAEGSRAS